MNLLCDDGKVCRYCGCSSFSCAGCILRTGAPCHWVGDDLCSACAQKPPQVSLGALQLTLCALLPTLAEERLGEEPADKWSSWVLRSALLELEARRANQIGPLLLSHPEQKHPLAHDMTGGFFPEPAADEKGSTH